MKKYFKNKWKDFRLFCLGFKITAFNMNKKDIELELKDILQ